MLGILAILAPGGIRDRPSMVRVAALYPTPVLTLASRHVSYAQPGAMVMITARVQG